MFKSMLPFPLGGCGVLLSVVNKHAPCGRLGASQDSSQFLTFLSLSGGGGCRAEVAAKIVLSWCVCVCVCNEPCLVGCQGLVAGNRGEVELFGFGDSDLVV